MQFIDNMPKEWYIFISIRYKCRNCFLNYNIDQHQQKLNNGCIVFRSLWVHCDLPKEMHDNKIMMEVQYNKSNI